MSTFSEIQKIASIEGLSAIDTGEIKLLYYWDWWGGYLSGRATYRGKKCWVEFFHETEGTPSDPYYRRFLVIELTDPQIQEKEYWQSLFVEKVGSGGVPDEKGIRHTNLMKPRATHHEFYDAYKKRVEMDLSDNLVLGYYDV